MELLEIQEKLLSLDASVHDSDMTDWELTFLASMVEKVQKRHRYFSPSQVACIERLVEKYI